MLDERQVVAKVRRVTLRELRLWVNMGWIQPAAGETGHVFDDLDVARIRLVCDLRKDMSLHADAVPVILSLLDQVQGLRRELRGIGAAIDAQPNDIRRAIIEASRRRGPYQG